MSRTLITKQNYREFLDPGEKTITLCGKMILTPGAKDFLREENIKICYGERKEPEKTAIEEIGPEKWSLKERIQDLLKKEFQCDDEALATRIASMIEKR